MLFIGYPMVVNKNTDIEFAYGTGHINPTRVINPGLVYDTREIDYVNFLCGQGHRNHSLRLVVEDNSSCTQATKKSALHLNYPSFILSSTLKSVFIRIFPRTVTNVGSPMSTYKSIMNAPRGMKIVVIPNVLSFESIRQRISCKVRVIGKRDQCIIFGSLIWFDEVHQVQVRSPVVAHVSS